MKSSEVEMQATAHRQERRLFEDKLSRANSELEQAERDAEFRSGELQSQLKHQRDATSSALEQASLRSSEMEMQAASHRRALLACEQQARTSDAESSTLRAELAQQGQALSLANETQRRQASELR